MSSLDPFAHYSIGLLCLFISNIFYFFYFDTITKNYDKPFLVAYLQSISYVIVSIMFCLFENSRFKLFKNTRNQLFYSPLSQVEDANNTDLFELIKPFTSKKDEACNSEKSFLTDPVFEIISEDEEEDDEQFKLKYQDKLNNYDDYLVKINQKYNELTKDDINRNKRKKKFKVKFDKKKEVRYLSDMYARSALLSRLSYEAFTTFNNQLLNKYSDLSFSNTLSIVPIYAVVRFLSIYFANLSLNYYFKSTNYFDLSSGFSLFFILLIQKFYFTPSLTEKISATKIIVCLLSIFSLYLIKLSSSSSFLSLNSSILNTPSNSIFLNQTILNDPNAINFFSFKFKSIVFTLLSSFFSTLFLVSLRNKYEGDDFNISIFSSFLSLFTVIIFGALVLFVLNKQLTDTVILSKYELTTIMHQALIGPCLGHFFLVM